MHIQRDGNAQPLARQVAAPHDTLEDNECIDLLLF